MLKQYIALQKCTELRVILLDDTGQCTRKRFTGSKHTNKTRYQTLMASDRSLQSVTLLSYVY